MNEKALKPREKKDSVVGSWKKAKQIRSWRAQQDVNDLAENSIAPLFSKDSIREERESLGRLLDKIADVLYLGITERQLNETRDGLSLLARELKKK